MSEYAPKTIIWHVINRDIRKPYTVELSKEYAEQFKEQFKEHLKMLHIIFEPSEAGDLINFKCWLNKNEFEMLSIFLKNMEDELEGV